MKQYIEAAFRVKFRLIICALFVFGVATAALVFSNKGYTSLATVWAEQPLYYKDQTNLNPYISVAENQVNVFNELMNTKQFSLSILTQAGQSFNSSADEDRAITKLRQNLRVEAAGPHLITITYRSDTPNEIKEVVTQAVQQFIAYMNSDRVNQANMALQIYQEQLSNYEDQMNQSTDALNKFLQQHPEVLIPGATPSTEFTDLQQRVFDDRTRYNSMKNTITDIQAQSQAASDVSNQFFQMVDQPEDARLYQLTGKDLFKNGLIALALALFTMVALLLVGTWTNTAIYTANDVRLTLPEGGDSPQDLLVATVPYINRLAALRRKSRKEELALAKAGAMQQTTTSGEARTIAKSI